MDIKEGDMKDNSALGTIFALFSEKRLSPFCVYVLKDTPSWVATQVKLWELVVGADRVCLTTVRNPWLFGLAAITNLTLTLYSTTPTSTLGSSVLNRESVYATRIRIKPPLMPPVQRKFLVTKQK
eukprot:g73949.t1